MFDSTSERQYPSGMPDVQPAAPSPPAAPAATNLTSRQREILEVIDRYMRKRGYPPSVREIGEAVGLTSPSTVHNHLASLQRRGLLRRDPTKPRAIEERGGAGATAERRPVRPVAPGGDGAPGPNRVPPGDVGGVVPPP